MTLPSSISFWRAETGRAGDGAAASGRAGRGLAAAVLAVSLAGCAVGPDFRPPDPQTPAQYGEAARQAGDPSRAAADPGGAKQAEPASRVTMQSEPDPRWWRGFGDPVLDSLIERAVAGNLTLRMAVLRIAQGRAQAQATAAAGLPSISATASYNRQLLGLKGILQSQHAGDRIRDVAGEDNADQVDGALDSLNRPTGLFQVGFDASWELDLFGRVRRAAEASEAQTQQAVESRNDALVSLQAEVAQIYAQLRGAQAQRQVLDAQLDSARQTLELTRSRQQSGLASEVDVANQGAQVAQLESQLPATEVQAQQARNGLAVLLGLPPGALDQELAAPAAVPAVPPMVPVGLPASLARRRPDVRQAEATLHAATAQIGASIAEMFPDISLSGQFGSRATDADYLGRWASRFWSVGPSVSLPLFQGGRLVANVRLARAQQAEAALNYRQTVLNALRDVENALVAYRSDQSQREALQRAVNEAERAQGLALDAYRGGLGSFLDVLSAQTRAQQARQAWVRSNLQVTTDLVAVYKALGGGWQDDASAQAAPPPVGTVGNAGQGTPQRETPP
ncbi:efflux transporter outer membrane subunit [Bordetella genomosp. 13]|uniref:efflux transporter outer membrane subunit n=1 Tax=Bordetella genomosp. 13 TaxID=463040 RepID=UPI00119CA30C|nr:efflux transporter outer membrane subunit [Bordetella genomosp. 13]